MSSHTARSLTIVASLAAGLSAHAGLRVVASVPGSDINVPSSNAADTVTFSGVADPIAGFGVTGLFTAPVADQIDGLYPWSVDFQVTATAPGGASATSPSPWFGDVSFADYPVADAFGGYAGVSGDGTWQLAFDSGVIPPYVAGLREVTYHLLAAAPDVEYLYSDNTGQGHSWSRPYYIAGVSGLGPVDYHTLEFTVDVSGLYHFQSVLATGGDHFTFLYEAAFDDTQPLANLVEYGLGNGFSPFNVPRGTSRFDQLLFAGTTYYWVTSEWQASSPPADFTNTITGPGTVTPAGAGCNPADVAEPHGVLDLADVQAFTAAFVSGDPLADLAPPAGVLDLADVQTFIASFVAGCP
ncbi:MAG: hypothetical protein H6810_12320 [Phycisphaeraceae bacterium]|nr:MAG: hypothetical protein H6810_12320 [Phycisphaeraceae bacterium]